MLAAFAGALEVLLAIVAAALLAVDFEAPEFDAPEAVVPPLPDALCVP